MALDLLPARSVSMVVASSDKVHFLRFAMTFSRSQKIASILMEVLCPCIWTECFLIRAASAACWLRAAGAVE